MWVCAYISGLTPQSIGGRINEDTLSDVVSSRNPFGISSSIRGKKAPFVNSLNLYSSDGHSYVADKIVTQGSTLVAKYKVLLSKVTSEHAGEPDKNGQVKIISRVQVMKPGEVCTDSYLVIGEFDNRREAENLLHYLKTRFARFMLLQAVSSINLSKDKFFFVPKQNFKEVWTDEKLYGKYGITKKEIEFIESLIKPME